MTYLRLILDQVRDGATHMAIDEILFLRSIQNGEINSILRFYRFSPPTITVGYGMWRDYSAIASEVSFSSLRAREAGAAISCSEIASASLGLLPRNDVEKSHSHSDIPVVRRLTGGGIVRHDQDLIYALIVPPVFLKKLGKVRESYRLIHSALIKVLERFGFDVCFYEQGCVETNTPFPKFDEDFTPLPFPLPLEGGEDKGEGELSLELKKRGTRGTGSFYCFDAPVLYDVMLGSVKVAGAGQKRSHQYLLQQGSIAWNLLIGRLTELSERDFQLEFALSLANLFGIGMKESKLTTEELKVATDYCYGYARAAV